MRLKGKRWLTILAAIVLSACAQPAPQVADVQPTSAVHFVTVVTPYISNDAALMQGVSTSIVAAEVLGGVVGGLIAGSIALHRQNAMNGILQRQGFSPQNELNTDIVNAVRARGYVVTVMQAPRPDTNFLGYYPLVKTDAYLDVTVPIYGYQQVGFGTYKPLLQAQYRLVTVKGAAIAMQGSASYTDSGPTYQFQNLTALDGDPKDVLAGLHSELSEVAVATANALP